MVAALLVVLYVILKSATSTGVAVPDGVVPALLSFFFFGVLVCAIRYGKKRGNDLL